MTQQTINIILFIITLLLAIGIIFIIIAWIDSRKDIKKTNREISVRHYDEDLGITGRYINPSNLKRITNGGSVIIVDRLPNKNISKSWVNTVDTIDSDIDDFAGHRATIIATNRYPDSVQTKKDRLLNLPGISFKYANKEQIKNLFYGYFREPIVESLIREFTSEASSDAGASIPQLIKAGISTSDIGKLIEKSKLPDVPLEEMFLRYQRETISKNQVRLDLEEVEIELSELQDFEETVRKLQTKFQLDISNDQIQSKKKSLTEAAAEKTLNKLENATGWVIIDGKFKISEEVDNIVCTFFHPVNRFLIREDNPVTIILYLAKSSLEPNASANFIHSLDKEIPLKVYGEVWKPINRASNDWNLTVTPLVVY